MVSETKPSPYSLKPSPYTTTISGLLWAHLKFELTHNHQIEVIRIPSKRVDRVIVRYPNGYEACRLDVNDWRGIDFQQWAKGLKTYNTRARKIRIKTPIYGTQMLSNVGREVYDAKPKLTDKQWHEDRFVEKFGEEYAVFYRLWKGDGLDVTMAQWGLRELRKKGKKMKLLSQEILNFLQNPPNRPCASPNQLWNDQITAALLLNNQLQGLQQQNGLQKRLLDGSYSQQVSSLSESLFGKTQFP